MPSKTNKHRPAKRVKTLVTLVASPPATVVTFYTLASTTGKLHYWHAMRCGKVVAVSSGGYSRKEKMKRSFLKLVDSFRAGNWTMSSQP